jgi:tetratricopeptide (TPR) repeat protein
MMSIMRSASGRGSLTVLLLWAMVSAVPAQAAEVESNLRKKALEVNAVTGDTATEGKITEMRKDADNSRKLLAVAKEMAKDPKNQPFNSTGTYILARVAQELKQVEISRTFYEIQIEQLTKLAAERKLASAYWNLIKLHIENDKADEGHKIFQKFLELQPADDENEGAETLLGLKRVVERMMLLLLARNGQAEKALKDIDRKLKRDPNSYEYMDLKGKVHREAGQLAEAIKTYQGIMETAGKADDLTEMQKKSMIDKCRYALSSVYVEMKDIDKAAEQLKTLLNKDPDNPTYNNDLGFIWADHDKNLEESEKMIRKAIESERKQMEKKFPDMKPEEIKDNASFLDSLGWVLFKQKKFKEGKTYLLRAIEDENGQNIEIYDHLADCLMELGEKKEAVETWKKGLEALEDVGSASKRDLDRKALIEKKLKEAK